MTVADTIVAVSTPPGQGGVGMVRMSGPQAILIGCSVFKSRPPLGRRVRHIEYGTVLDETGKGIDIGLAWVFRAPRSYTGEDMVEISCHGSNLVLEALVRSAISRGAVLAAPGEFTRRAFLNGRIDLPQAEAVIDLIQAGSRFGLDNAYGQASGRLSRLVTELKSHIVKVLSLIEVSIDFAEEDLGIIERRPLLMQMNAAHSLARRLADTFEGSRRRQSGFSVAIIGRPNVGKSTIFNALLGEDRAIVTPIPGTTRDFVEAQVDWGGEKYRLVDTAGLRNSEDPIEREGVRRARKVLDRADFVLAVFDSSQCWEREDQEVISLLDEKKGVVVFNKIDLPHRLTLPQGQRAFRRIDISALTGEGLDELQDHIAGNMPRTTLVEGVGITRQRHHSCLVQVIEHLEKAQEMLLIKGNYECIAVELQEALRGVGEILGENVSEEVLDQIFSDFCIGK